MIPPLTPDQISQYLTDPNPIIATLALYITETAGMTARSVQSASLPTLQDVFLGTPDRLIAMYEAASGVWVEEDEDISPA